MRKMIKPVGSAFLFFGGLLFLMWLISLLLVPKTPAMESGMRDPSANGILSEPASTIDVLFLGDSETGITSYCCGTPAQKLCYAQEFLEKCFEKQSPKMVILETNEIFRKFSVTDSLLHKPSAPILSLFNYHDRWKTLSPVYSGPSVNYTFLENAKGYRFSATASKASTKGYMDSHPGMARIAFNNYTAMEKMKRFCVSHGARLVLVSTPSTVNWNMKRHNSIRELAEELGLEYMDLNLLPDEVPIDWKTDTRDKGDHLNYFGAKKVTTYIADYLKKTELFADRRDDPTFQQWSKDAKAFDRMIQKPVEKVKRGNTVALPAEN